MFALLKRSIFEKRKSLIAMSLVCALLVWMYVAFYPGIKEESAALQEAFSNYPEGFLKVFGIDPAEFNIFDTFESFLTVEHYSLLWPLVIIIFVISMGGSFIAGEVDDKTIEFLLAQPISRLKIFFSKYIAGIFLILILTFVSVYSVMPFTSLHDVEIQLENYAYIAFLGFLFAIAIYCVSLMFSSMFSSKSRAASVTTGILIVMYALKLMSAFKESVENVKYLSFFHYFDYNAALVNKEIRVESILVFLLTAFVCTVVGAFVWVRRDVAA